MRQIQQRKSHSTLDRNEQEHEKDLEKEKIHMRDMGALFSTAMAFSKGFMQLNVIQPKALKQS